ncbi:hypothetical protein BTM36_19790 [Herbaspirillum sp. VT-16-41]|nr:hypothetical protein BTM36_19790 [Herbaspirillum sp. VT-16-41]
MIWSAYVTAANLKVGAAVCGVLGSLILAYRVTGILSALTTVVAFLEENIKSRLNNRGDVVFFGNISSIAHAAQRKPLLYLGFFFFSLSAILQLASLFV